MYISLMVMWISDWRGFDCWCGSICHYSIDPCEPWIDPCACFLYAGFAVLLLIVSISCVLTRRPPTFQSSGILKPWRLPQSPVFGNSFWQAAAAAATAAAATSKGNMAKTKETWLVEEAILTSKYYRRPLPTGFTALTSREGINLVSSTLAGYKLRFLYELLGRLERGGPETKAWPGWACLALGLNGLCPDENRLWPGSWR